MSASPLLLLAKNWWLLFLRGLFGTAFGLLAVARPNLTLKTLILVYGSIVALVGSGTLSVIFGLFIFVWSSAGAISLIRFIGGYAIVNGVLCIGLAFRLKPHQPAH